MSHMKQSNQAITFLMAQYRAVLKNTMMSLAVGISTTAASLCIATSAFAIPQDGMWDKEDFSSDPNGGVTGETLITSQAFDASSLANGWGYASGTTHVATNLLVNIEDVKETVAEIRGAKDKNLAFEKLFITDGACVNITNTADTDTKIYGYAPGTAADGTAGTLHLSSGKMELNKAHVRFGTIKLEDKSEITLGGIVDASKKSNSDKADWVHYSAVYSPNAADFSFKSSEKSVVNLNDQSLIGGEGVVLLENSTVNFNGKLDQNDSASALVRSPKQVTVDGSTLYAKGAGAIYSPIIEFKSNAAQTVINIEDGGRLILDGDWKDEQLANAVAHNASKISFDNLTVNGKGTLVLGNSNAQTNIAAKNTLTFNSKLENHARIEFNDKDTWAGTDILVLNGDLINSGELNLFASANARILLPKKMSQLHFINQTMPLDISDTSKIQFSSNLQTEEPGKISITNDAGEMASRATIKGEMLSISKPISGFKYVYAVEADHLTLGSPTFDSHQETLHTDKKLLANKEVTFIVKDGKTFVLSAPLTLGNSDTTTGTIKGAFQLGLVNVSRAAQLRIENGHWTLEQGQDFFIDWGAPFANDGGAVIITGNNTSLSASGKLKTTSLNNSDGIVIKSGALLDIAQADTSGLLDNAVNLNTFAKVKLDANKVLASNFNGSFLNGDPQSFLELTGKDKITKDEFNNIKSKFNNFSGIYDGFEVEDLYGGKSKVPIDQLDFKAPIANNKNVQAIVSKNVNQPGNAGSILLSGIDVFEFNPESEKTFILSNASANNNPNKNFVQKDGETNPASVKLGGFITDWNGNHYRAGTLVLLGEGNIGTVLGIVNRQAKLNIGMPNNSHIGDVTVKGNIGELYSNQVESVEISKDSKLTVEGSVYVKYLKMASGSTFITGTDRFDVENVNMAAGSTISGNGSVVIKGLKMDRSASIVSPDHEVSFENKPATIEGTITAATLTFGNMNTAYHKITGDAKINVAQLTPMYTAKVKIGDDSAKSNGSATVIAKKLSVVGSAELWVDTEYGQKAALLMVDELNDAPAASAYSNDLRLLTSNSVVPTQGVNAGTLKTNLIVGKNALTAIGFTSEQDLMDLLKSNIDQNGSFYKSPSANTLQLSGALVLNKAITIDSFRKVVLDTLATLDTLGGYSYNSITLSSGTALIITEQAFGTDKDGNKTGPAITFNMNYGTVNGEGGVVILHGNFSTQDNDLKLFGTANGQLPSLNGKIVVRSANGWLIGGYGNFPQAPQAPGGTPTPPTTLPGGTGGSGGNGNLGGSGGGTGGGTGGGGTGGGSGGGTGGGGTGGFNPSIDVDKVKEDLAGTAGPVFGIIMDVLNGKYKNDSGAGVDALRHWATVSSDGYEIEAVSNLANYAGASLASLSASHVLSDAVASRLGTSISHEKTINATGSLDNGGVWLSPSYQKFFSDGFDAQGGKYGADVDLAGIVLGSDYVFDNKRFGVMLNIGSGEAEGKGNGRGLNNDFDYYGLGVYSSYNFDNVSVCADVSYTHISHDLSGKMPSDKIGFAKAETDSNAISFGVTTSYKIENDLLDVTPHLGARFTRLDTDTYGVDTKLGTVAITEFHEQNILSVPVGVALSERYEFGDWSIAPNADMTFTLNIGDLKADYVTSFTGASNSATNFSPDMLDELTYSLDLGLSAKNGAFGGSVGLNYTGSDNTDAISLKAQASYMF